MCVVCHIKCCTSECQSSCILSQNFKSVDVTIILLLKEEKKMKGFAVRDRQLLTEVFYCSIILCGEKIYCKNHYSLSAN